MSFPKWLFVFSCQYHFNFENSVFLSSNQICRFDKNFMLHADVVVNTLTPSDVFVPFCLKLNCFAWAFFRIARWDTPPSPVDAATCSALFTGTQSSTIAPSTSKLPTARISRRQSLVVGSSARSTVFEQPVRDG